MADKNNPQAFPSTWHSEQGNQGMTLLDYFAAKAMQAFIPHISYSPYDITEDAVSAEELAIQSYAVAAAMLEERKKYINQ